MPHVHFIAIGGAAMHSLAIALSEDPAYRVTGSDDEIFEPSRSRLQAHGLLPAETGWHPERIDGSIDAVVVVFAAIRVFGIEILVGFAPC